MAVQNVKMLPGEHRARQLLRRAFSSDFALARQVLELGYRVHHDLCEEETSRFGNLAKGICVGLYTKMCKQYRSIHALCELGLTDDAEILVRTMFETCLSVLFLLRKRAILRHGKRLPPKPIGGQFSVSFRAELYTADQALQLDKRVRDWLSTTRLKRNGKRLECVATDWVDTARKAVGDDWLKWLKTGSTFGLSIEIMAKNLGMGIWYSAVYRPQSAKVHAADADQHLESDDFLPVITPKLKPNTTTTTMPLRLANILIMMAGDLINSRFRLGHDEGIRSIRKTILSRQSDVDEL